MPAAAWGQQVDPNQWGAYYGYGQGYDAYSYGSAAMQDPSAYAYGAYAAGYMQYPQVRIFNLVYIFSSITHSSTIIKIWTCQSATLRLKVLKSWQVMLVNQG